MGAGCAFRRLVSEPRHSWRAEAITIHEKGFSPEPLRSGPHTSRPEDTALLWEIARPMGAAIAPMLGQAHLWTPVLRQRD